MKQTKHKHIVSIWHRPPKGIRAGNSPVWKPGKVGGDSAHMDDAEFEYNDRERASNQEYPDTDQLGWEGGEGEKKASKNITGITKKWK